MPDTSNTYRGIQVSQSDQGFWYWCNDEKDAGDIHATEEGARAQIDAHLGSETEDAECA